MHWGSPCPTVLVAVSGAALGPLLTGWISPTGWKNVFYMLITANILAAIVRPLFSLSVCVCSEAFVLFVCVCSEALVLFVFVSVVRPWFSLSLCL